MSQYTPVTNFVSKDALISGNPLKLVKGADLTTEFAAVQTALNSKADGFGIITVGGSNGILVGSPTGGDKGSATLNAQSLYASGNPVFGSQVNQQSGNYTLVLADAGGVLTTGANGNTFTIPSNASVAFPVGTIINFIYEGTFGSLLIAINSDTLHLANSASVGTRTLASNGVAQAIKGTPTAWWISGTGLT